MKKLSTLILAMVLAFGSGDAGARRKPQAVTFAELTKDNLVDELNRRAFFPGLNAKGKGRFLKKKDASASRDSFRGLVNELKGFVDLNPDFLAKVKEAYKGVSTAKGKKGKNSKNGSALLIEVKKLIEEAKAHPKVLSDEAKDDSAVNAAFEGLLKSQKLSEQEFKAKLARFSSDQILKNQDYKNTVKNLNEYNKETDSAKKEEAKERVLSFKLVVLSDEAKDDSAVKTAFEDFLKSQKLSEQEFKAKLAKFVSDQVLKGEDYKDTVKNLNEYNKETDSAKKEEAKRKLLNFKSDSKESDSKPRTLEDVLNIAKAEYRKSLPSSSDSDVSLYAGRFLEKYSTLPTDSAKKEMLDSLLKISGDASVTDKLSAFTQLLENGKYIVSSIKQGDDLKSGLKASGISDREAEVGIKASLNLEKRADNPSSTDVKDVIEVINLQDKIVDKISGSGSIVLKAQGLPGEQQVALHKIAAANRSSLEKVVAAASNEMGESVSLVPTDPNFGFVANDKKCLLDIYTPGVRSVGSKSNVELKKSNFRVGESSLMGEMSRATFADSNVTLARKSNVAEHSGTDTKLANDLGAIIDEVRKLPIFVLDEVDAGSGAGNDAVANGRSTFREALRKGAGVATRAKTQLADMINSFVDKGTISNSKYMALIANGSNFDGLGPVGRDIVAADANDVTKCNDLLRRFSNRAREFEVR